MIVASSTPDVERHLEPDDEDPEVELGGSLSEGVLTMVLVQPTLAKQFYNYRDLRDSLLKIMLIQFIFTAK